MNRLSNAGEFMADYSKPVNGLSTTTFTNLDALKQYLRARKVEAYGDTKDAAQIYEEHPVLDALSRTGNLTRTMRQQRYTNALALLKENTHESVA